MKRMPFAGEHQVRECFTGSAAGKTNRGLIEGVTAVIACYNSSNVIGPTMEALLGQQLDNNITLEIILADNNCTDDTVEKAKKIYTRYKNNGKAGKNIRFSVIREPEPGAAFARKTAVLNASCGIISFIDDDNILEKDWIQKVFYLFKQKPGVGVIGGYNEPHINGNAPGWFEAFQHSYACGPQAETSSYVTARKYVYGAGSSYRTGILLNIYNSRLPLFLTGKKAGAFLMSGNDSEMCHRAVLMGWELWYEETLRLKHNLVSKRLTWKSLCHMQAAHSAALIILDIYRSLIERRKVKNYYEMLFNIIKETVVFLLRHLRGKTIKEVKQEGTRGAISYHHYRGMLKSAVIHRSIYKEIRSEIARFYKNNNFSTFIPPPPAVIPEKRKKKKKNKRKSKKKWNLFPRLSKIKILITKPFIKRELSKYLNRFSKIDNRKAGKITASTPDPLLKDIEYGNKYRLSALFFRTVAYDRDVRYIYLLWESLKKQEMAYHLSLTMIDSQGEHRFWTRPAFGELNTTVEPGEFIFGIIEIPAWVTNLPGFLAIRLVIPGDHGLEIKKGTTDMNKTRLLIPMNRCLQKENKRPGGLNEGL